MSKNQTLRFSCVLCEYALHAKLEYSYESCRKKCPSKCEFWGLWGLNNLLKPIISKKTNVVFFVHLVRTSSTPWTCVFVRKLSEKFLSKCEFWGMRGENNLMRPIISKNQTLCFSCILCESALHTKPEFSYESCRKKFLSKCEFWGLGG
jgi:hypothetical protein